MTNVPAQLPHEQKILEVLYALSYRTRDLKGYLKIIAQGVSELLHIDWSVVTFCRENEERVFASSLDLGEAGDEIYSLHGSLTGTVVKTGNPLVVEDTNTCTDYGKAPEGYRAYLGVPLRTSFGEVIGTICSFHHQARLFEPEEVRLATIFAERAATAIDNYQLYEQLQQFNDRLEAEVMQRTIELRSAQAKLMEINADLEQRVEQRTAELKQMNQQLKAEIQERQEMEQALRQNEELFRQFAENLEQVLWMRTPDHQPIYVSPAFETIWGHSCQDWYQQPDLEQQTLHPEDRERLHLEQQNSEIEQAQTVSIEHKVEQEYQIIRPDGSIRLIRNQAFPVRNEQGEVYRIAGIAEDMTDRKQAEQAHLQATAALAEVGELASMIVHEIRNPLTTICMGLNAFKRMELPDSAQERLGLALEEADRLRNLLNEILLYAKSQTFQCSELQLNEFMMELLGSLRTMPSAHKRQIHFVAAPDNIRLWVDVNKLKQVIINLVDNACEATQENEDVVVKLSSTPTQASIQVCNGGDPIPEQLLAKITKPFYTTKSSGTGLGLAIVKRIVEAHQGTLTIESSADCGTTVTVSLPLACVSFAPSGRER